jgi:hypothetical protein
MGNIHAPSLKFFQDEQTAAVDAGCKLLLNFDKVVNDIVNQGPLGLGGGALSQSGELTRVDPKSVQHVKAMMKGAIGRLLGNQITVPGTAEEALVWNQAARFLRGRVQGSAAECQGREPDMSAGAANAMRTVLGQIESGCKILSNRVRIKEDITNPAPKSQDELKRVDRSHIETVDAMLGEVANRLLGKAPSNPPAMQQALVWAQAAKFFAKRIQAPVDSLDCEKAGFPSRKSDMSAEAAAALSKVLGQLEGSCLLMSNRETVVKDITNPGPDAVKGGKMTQLKLKRVDPKDKAAVDKMVGGVSNRLFGNEMSLPTSPEEALAWTQAAAYLSGRIQSCNSEAHGRPADMSKNAAKEMRAVLAQVEAGSKLVSNRKKVVQDIVNNGQTAVDGGAVTQTNLSRVDSSSQAAVDAMIGELCNRLAGQRKVEPSSPAEAQVWTQAATYLNARIQAAENECKGRAPDMSPAAATAMRGALAGIPSQTRAVPAAATGLYGAMKNM